MTGERARGVRGVRGAVLATVLLFSTNGAIFGAVVPRLPDLKDALGLGAAEFGVAMACYPVGALVGGVFAPVLMRRYGDGLVSVGMMVLASAVAAALGHAPVVAVFAALLLVFGVADALTDVAMNAHGLRVQLRHGASLINRFHAVWSGGAVLGALGGSVAAGVGVSVVAQMAVAGAVCAVLALVAVPLCLPGGGDPAGARASDDTASEATATRRTATVRPGGRTLVLLLAFGLIAACAALVEDFGQTWSALHLREVAGAGAGVAGLGFIVVQGAQLLGRVTGDRLVDIHGAARVGRRGGLCVVVGAGVALPAVAVLEGPALLVVLLAGFALAGWGIATVIPGAMAGSDAVPGLAPGAGLAVLNWVIRIGFLVSPPLVGLIAEYAGLPWTVAPMMVGGVLIVVLAGPLFGRLDRRDPAPDPAPRRTA